MKNIAITKGCYTRDFYILPTILVHHGDCYKTFEIVWLKWYLGFIKKY